MVGNSGSSVEAGRQPKRAISAVAHGNRHAKTTSGSHSRTPTMPRITSSCRICSNIALSFSSTSAGKKSQPLDKKFQKEREDRSRLTNLLHDATQGVQVFEGFEILGVLLQLTQLRDDARPEHDARGAFSPDRRPRHGPQRVVKVGDRAQFRFGERVSEGGKARSGQEVPRRRRERVGRGWRR